MTLDEIIERVKLLQHACEKADLHPTLVLAVLIADKITEFDRGVYQALTKSD